MPSVLERMYYNFSTVFLLSKVKIHNHKIVKRHIKLHIHVCKIIHGPACSQRHIIFLTLDMNQFPLKSLILYFDIGMSCITLYITYAYVSFYNSI